VRFAWQATVMIFLACLNSLTDDAFLGDPAFSEPR
jgi:hypothetical protein